MGKRRKGPSYAGERGMTCARMHVCVCVCVCVCVSVCVCVCDAASAAGICFSIFSLETSFGLADYEK